MRSTIWNTTFLHSKLTKNASTTCNTTLSHVQGTKVQPMATLHYTFLSQIHQKCVHYICSIIVLHGEMLISPSALMQFTQSSTLACQWTSWTISTTGQRHLTREWPTLLRKYWKSVKRQENRFNSGASGCIDPGLRPSMSMGCMNDIHYGLRQVGYGLGDQD